MQGPSTQGAAPQGCAYSAAMPDMYLREHVKGTKRDFSTFDAAKAWCNADPQCGGITYTATTQKYQPRRGVIVSNNAIPQLDRQHYSPWDRDWIGSYRTNAIGETRRLGEEVSFIKLNCALNG